MYRLLASGSEDNAWENLLNDFLYVEHNANGTLTKNNLVDSGSILLGLLCPSQLRLV